MPRPSLALRRKSALLYDVIKARGYRPLPPARTDTHDERMTWTLADMRGIGGLNRDTPPPLATPPPSPG